MLCCPFCAASIRVTRVLEQGGNGIEYGLLQCLGCRFEYPIIAGIPLVFGPEDAVDLKAETDARTVLRGPNLSDLVRVLKDGDPGNALSLLLGPAADRGSLFPALPRPSRAVSGSRRIRPRERRETTVTLRIGRKIIRPVRGVLWRLLLPAARRRIAQFLRTNASELSALDVIRLYYDSFSGVEMFNYFAFRFGQPRYLAALSLASLFQRTRGALLDLACGMGHLTHYLTRAFPGQPVFALDREFFRLYVAKRYVAPDATFVCAPADQALPFPPGFFSGVICSDAFHYFEYRAAAVRETLRLLSDDGVLILCRFGNRDVEPREGYELTVHGYRQLVSGVPHVVLTEDDLVSRYLKRLGPELCVEQPLDVLTRQKWLSLVAARNQDVFRPVSFEDWPHAVGRLQLNPIYAVTSLQGGNRKLTFQFPSTWYEFENARYRQYAAADCVLSQTDMESLARGERSSRIDDLISECVVLGMPDAYLVPRCGTVETHRTAKIS